MVKRDSKYKTNKTISKNIGASVNDQLNDKAREAADNLDKESTHMDDTTEKFTSDFGTKVKVHTDTSHYEVIDKRERKKVYSKCKEANLDNEETKESPYDPVKNKEKRKYEFGNKVKAEVPDEEFVEEEEVPATEEELYEAKLERKEETKKGSKSHFIEGNLNRALNPIEDLSELPVSKKEYGKSVISHKKNQKVYNKGSKVSKKNYADNEDHHANRASKKHLTDEIINNEAND
jgi:hypothetical protein